MKESSSPFQDYLFGSELENARKRAAMRLRGRCPGELLGRGCLRGHAHAGDCLVLSVAEHERAIEAAGEPRIPIRVRVRT